MIFILVFILSLLSFIIYSYYKKRHNYNILKRKIENLLKSIENVKNKIGILPYDLNEIYETKIDILTKDNVNDKTRIDMTYIYNVLLEHQKIINNIKNSITEIKKSKSDVEKYLQDNYTYSEKYLKLELEKIFDEYNIQQLEESEFDSKLMFKLIGIKKALNNKINFFLDKIVRINNVINDKENFEKTLEELKKSYIIYITKNNLLLYSNNKYLSQNDFNKYIIELKNNIMESFNELNVDINSTLAHYNKYLTNISILKGKFKNMNDLYDNDQKNRDF